MKYFCFGRGGIIGPAAQGVGWWLMSTSSFLVLRLLVKLVLAHMLLPRHYEIIGMALVVFGLSVYFAYVHFSIVN